MGTEVALTRWIESHGHRLTSLDLDAPLDDLEPLRDLVGSARVVALGESSHHVREFYQLRHRMLRFLVERCGFTSYVLEAPVTEGQVLDAWVTGAPGEVDRVASEGIAMSLGDVPELHEVLRWLRAYNGREPAAPVHCIGADLPGSIGSPLPALVEAGHYLDRYDPGARDLLDRAIATAREFHDPSAPTGEMMAYPALPEPDRDALTVALSGLTARMERLGARQRGGALAEEHARAARHLRGAWLLDHVHRATVATGIEEASTFRDLYIAEQVLRLLEADPCARIVLAAHNWHIKKSVEQHESAQLDPAGSHLDTALGTDYVAIGMTGRSGRTAVADGEAMAGSGGFLFREVPLPPPEEGTIEADFPDDGLARLVDLRHVPAQVAGDWSHPRMRMADYSLEQPAFSSFDALVCVTRTTGTANTR